MNALFVNHHLTVLLPVQNFAAVPSPIGAVAVTMEVLILVAVLVWIAQLQGELEEFDVLLNLLLRQVVFYVFDEVDSVRLIIEEGNGSEVFEEDDLIFLLNDLCVVSVLVLEPVHVAEVRHRLLESSIFLQSLHFHERPLSMIAVEHYSIIEAPNLEMKCELDEAFSVNLQRFHFQRVLFRSFKLHLRFHFSELFSALLRCILSLLRKHLNLLLSRFGYPAVNQLLARQLLDSAREDVSNLLVLIVSNRKDSRLHEVRLVQHFEALVV